MPIKEEKIEFFMFGVVLFFCARQTFLASWVNNQRGLCVEKFLNKLRDCRHKIDKKIRPKLFVFAAWWMMRGSRCIRRFLFAHAQVGRDWRDASSDFISMHSLCAHGKKNRPAQPDRPCRVDSWTSDSRFLSVGRVRVCSRASDGVRVDSWTSAKLTFEKLS